MYYVEYTSDLRWTIKYFTSYSEENDVYYVNADTEEGIFPLGEIHKPKNVDDLLGSMGTITSIMSSPLTLYTTVKKALIICDGEYQIASLNRETAWELFWLNSNSYIRIYVNNLLEHNSTEDIVKFTEDLRGKIIEIDGNGRCHFLDRTRERGVSGSFNDFKVYTDKGNLRDKLRDSEYEKDRKDGETSSLTDNIITLEDKIKMALGG